jgi:Uma2 family endonuclease
MMATATEPKKPRSYTDYVPTLVAPGFPLLASDGIPMEDNFHVREIFLLLDMLATRYPNRADYFAGGNMFLYYSAEQARNRDYKGPDFFFVKGVDAARKRSYWAIWDEGGRFPNVIMEMLSPTTEREDRTTKKELYEKVFRTPEYFIYDFATAALEGWRLDENGVYQPLAPNNQGRLWSEELEIWLGTWDGSYLTQTTTWLRGFDEQGRLLPVSSEIARDAEAEIARLRELLARGDRGAGNT